MLKLAGIMKCIFNFNGHYTYFGALLKVMKVLFSNYIDSEVL